MNRLGRISGLIGFVALVSIPLTLFLLEWEANWVVWSKLVFGVLAIGFWLVTHSGVARQTFQGHSVFYGGFSVLFVVLAILLVVFLNYVFYQYPVRVDLTERKIHSLSDQTRKILAELEQEVKVLAFYGPKEREFGLVRDVLERYRVASNRFRYEFVDPVDRPELVDAHKIHQGGPRLIVFYGDRRERVKLGGPGQGGPEESLTSALLRVTAKGAPRRICFSTGHGEKALSGKDQPATLSLFVQDLQNRNFAIDSISLLDAPEVPKACEIVILAGPREDLTGEERKSLEEFIETGGRLMAFLGSSDTASLNPLLAKSGIMVGSNTVIFPEGRRPANVVTDPGRYPKSHPIFSRFFQPGVAVLRQTQAVFPMARSVSVAPATPGENQATELVFSPAHAWGEIGKLVEGEQVDFDPDTDLRGPVPMAVVVEAKSRREGEHKPDKARMAVFGSSLMVTDAAYRVYPFNRDLVMNTVAWLTREEKKISILPRYRAASLIRLDDAQEKFITLVLVDVLPLLILAFGLVIWQLRKWS
jgi:hypothetical protein